MHAVRAYLLLQGGVAGEHGARGEHLGGLVRVGREAAEHALHVGGGHHLRHQGRVVPGGVNDGDN